MNKAALSAASRASAGAAPHGGSAASNLLPPRAELVQKHLEKLQSSAALSRSKKLCQFLRFTVDEVLQGHGAELKEYAIGVGVFRRGREFDPGADPIVRVQARRLRAKLASYYLTEGRDEPLRIEYPVGSYSPIFTRRTASADISRQSGAIQAASTVKQIAVLPFLNVGAEECQPFSDGLTEDLMHALSGLSGVSVVARASCFEFKGLSADVRMIGERLGASELVSGSVRLEADQLRVLAQLIDTDTGVVSWSGAYDRRLDGILATQEKIAQEIAASLKSRLAAGGNGKASVAASLPVHVEPMGRDT